MFLSFRSDYLPVIWGHLGMSLRDLDYCVRTVSLVGKNLALKSPMFPSLLGLLIPLKLKNNALYRRFLEGTCRASEVMNYVDYTIPLEDLEEAALITLDMIEAELYRSEASRTRHQETPSAISQLDLLLSDTALTHPEYLSDRTQTSELKRIGQLKEYSTYSPSYGYWGNIVDSIGGLVDLHQPPIRS